MLPPSIFPNRKPLSFILFRCGGVGITLNGADRVVIFDPAWNPAVDAQVTPHLIL